VGGLSSSAWSGGVFYPVQGVWFTSHFGWREPIVSRILGHNQRPTVPGYFTPIISKIVTHPKILPQNLVVT
jgi:hypothetical protein